MPLPTISGTYRCSVQGVNANGTPWVNVLHFNWIGAGSPTSTDLANLATKIQKLYAGPAYTSGAGLIVQCLTTVTVTQVTITPLDGSSLSTQIALTGAGAATGLNLPPEVSEVLTLRTAFRGRSRRGRIYLPAWAQNVSTAAGLIGTTQRNLAVTQATAFIADVATVSWNWCVASYKLSIATTITNVTMDVNFDVQRRRKS